MTRHIVKPSKQLIADTLNQIRKHALTAQKALRKDDLEAVFAQMDAVSEDALAVQNMLAERQRKLKEAADRPNRAKRERIERMQQRLEKLQIELAHASAELDD